MRLFSYTASNSLGIFFRESLPSKSWPNPVNIRLDEDVFGLRLQKTSSRCLQDVLIKTNIFALVIRLQDVFIKTNIFVLVIRLQDVFKTSSTRFQDLFKTSSRCFENVFKTSSRHLQDVFKTYYQVKLFLVTQFQDVIDTYSKRFWDVLLRRLYTGGLPRSHFWETYGQCTKFPRVIKISLRTWLNISNGVFFRENT